MISEQEILNARILIVDDQEANVLLLREILRDAGYVSITSTMDSGKVCELHLKNRYDLILLDLQMPGMDGFQVMECLNEIETNDYLPVLVITAQPGHKLRALAAGAKDFISKPFDLPEVLVRVKNMLKVRLLHNALHNYNVALEQRVRERTADLQESYRKLQQLALHQDYVKEEERGRIARELHDEMGATLTVLKMNVHWLAAKLPAEMPQLTAEAEHIDKLVADAIHTMRHVVSQLMPTQLHDLGLASAVERYVRDFQNRTGIECGLVLPEQDLTLDENQSSVMFRILQESLNNIAKHAQAAKVSVLFIQRDHLLMLVVKDDGVGFDRNTHTNDSFGLLGIRERARMVNGKARISSKPGKGTQVVIRIPLEPKNRS